jgi:hypothetical protein
MLPQLPYLGPTYDSGSSTAREGWIPCPRQRFAKNGEGKLVDMKEGSTGERRREKEKREAMVKCESVCVDLSKEDVKRLAERAVEWY